MSSAQLAADFPRLDTCPRTSARRGGAVFLAAALGALTAIGPRLTAQDYTFAVDAPATVLLDKIDTPVTFKATCLLEMDASAAGVQGWTVGVAVEGPLAITAVTTSGTVAAETDADPPGLRDGGFEVTELAAADGIEGAVSSVILALFPPVTLAWSGSPYTILELTLEARGEGDARIYFYDGLEGSGEGIRNTVSESGFDVVPVLIGADVSISALVLVPDIEAPAAIEFGTLAPGSEASQAVTISNVGEGALRLSSAVMASGGSPDFRVESLPTAIELAPGAAADLLVTYAPAEEGADTAALVISSDDPDEPTLTVALSGAGASTDPAAITVDRPRLDFGRVAIGTSRTLTVNVSNRGGEAVELSRIGLDAPASSAFALAGEVASGSIPAGSEVAIAVTFTPSRPGPDRSALRIESVVAGTIVVPLAGAGVQDVGFRRGDANADGRIDMSDPITVLAHLFLGGARPPCLDAADSDDSGLLEITDALILLRFLFNGGLPPRSPHPGCGPDVAPDSFPSCTYPATVCPSGR